MLDPFKNINEKNKKKLLKLLYSDTIIFDKNDKITSEYIYKNSIGILISGYIQVIRNNSNGNSVLIEDFIENDIFDLYDNYSDDLEYEIICKEKSKIIFIDLNELDNFNDNKKQYYNTFIKNLLLILNNKMKEKNKRIKILTKKTIRNRLLEYFNTSSNSGSNVIYLPYSFMALADYLGVDRSALSREIKYLKEEGFIEVKSKKIILLYK